MFTKYIIKLILGLLLLIGLTEEAYSQSQATALFLRIPPSARAWGLGRAYIALSDDIGAAYYNPAGLVNLDNNELTLMYAPWLKQFVDDLHYSYLAWGKSVQEIGQIAAHLTFLSLGQQDRTTETGNPAGHFSSYEMALSLSYGTYIFEYLSVGATIKYIHSHLAPSGAGAERGSGVGKSWAVDMGLIYQCHFLEELKLAASLVNVGPNMAYIDYAQADPLPRTLIFGVSYDLIDEEYYSMNLLSDVNIDVIDLGSDLDYLLGDNKDQDSTSVKRQAFDDIIYCFGAEFWYVNTIALRAGYYLDDLGDIKAPTFGAGLKWQKFQFDFGYFHGGSNHPLEGQLLFSLLFRY